MNFKLLMKDPTLEIMSLLEYEDLTVREIRQKLGNVPKATLYRHIKKMHENNLIKVSRTRIINGLKQHTYTMNRDDDIIVKEDDFKNLSNQERIDFYMKNFMSFVKSLIKVFRKNTYNNNFSLILVRFRVNVTKEESHELYGKIKNLVEEYSSNTLTEDRHVEEVTLVMQDLKDYDNEKS